MRVTLATEDLSGALRRCRACWRCRGWSGWLASLCVYHGEIENGRSNQRRSEGREVSHRQLLHTTNATGSLKLREPVYLRHKDIARKAARFKRDAAVNEPRFAVKSVRKQVTHEHDLPKSATSSLPSHGFASRGVQLPCLGVALGSAALLPGVPMFRLLIVPASHF